MVESSSKLKEEKPEKPQFRRAKDDTKPQLHDPILRSDPIESEEAVLRLPPLPRVILASLEQQRK